MAWTFLRYSNPLDRGSSLATIILSLLQPKSVIGICLHANKLLISPHASRRKLFLVGGTFQNQETKAAFSADEVIRLAS